LRINFSVKFGHPLRKPFRTAFSSVDIFGLHNDLWANLTLFARVFTECVNIARLTTLLATSVASVGGCGAQPSQGLGRGRIYFVPLATCPGVVHIPFVGIGSIHKSVDPSLNPLKNDHFLVHHLTFLVVKYYFASCLT
jgi:hypothetical protein